MTKTLLILGGGTAGTMAANRLAQELDLNEWRIVVVDQERTHYYQPGFLFLPFDLYKKQDVVKPRRDFFLPGVEFVLSEIDVIEPDRNRVRIRADGGRYISYDFLIIATGTSPRPEETPGMKDGGLWYRDIFDFYTLEGALRLTRRLRTWEGGRLVLNIVEMPIKCPVAPLEFIFLADWYLRENGLREKTEIVYVTPLPGAFTKPRASSVLGHMLEERGIQLVTDYYIERVDPQRKVIVSYDEREEPFDLLVTIPLNKGSDVIARSGMGDELNYVPTDKYTLRSQQFENVFVLGDATNVPTSKAGSVAHFMVDAFVPNFLRYIEGQELLPTFDGHANCYIETGFGRGLLIDFNYDVEPLPGKFPLPGLGPFSLLQESVANHWGKMLFRTLYWHVLMKGRRLPMPAQMMMAGKWA